MSSKWSDRLRHTLGFRLALWYAVVFVASACALVALTYVLLAASLRQYDRDTIETTLLQFADAYARGGVSGLAREIETAQVATTPGPLFVRTIGARRDVVFFTMPDQWRHFDLSQLSTPSLRGEQTWATLRTGTAGDELEVASVQLRDGTLLQVGKSTERRAELLRRFRRVLLIDVGSIVLIGLAGGAVLTASALRPVRALADTVRGIVQTGRTDLRVPPPPSDDALGELGTLVNAMLERIDAVVTGMRGALDNVAHDLRTPLTRLRGVAEAALASDQPAQQRDALVHCVEESDRVVTMLHALMDISEAETGTMTLRREALDLGDLLRQTRDLYEDAAEERGLAIVVEVEDAPVVTVDRTRVRQVLANLVDNAVKYTPAGGRVTLAAVRDRDEAVVTVTDTGPGISADDLPRVWERLYRGDRSRTTRGLGLGLSLVKAIVEAHGGRVAAQSPAGGGARLEVRLPIVNSQMSAM